MTDEIDPREFRDACAQFMTGVTVITTRAEDGTPVGFTANSFTSVSLQPPMVLFCLGVTSESIPAFDSADGFVVHVLGGDQQELSMRFASKGVDRFEGVDWSPGHTDLPIIAGALSIFECTSKHRYVGGDHVIYVGEVTALHTGDHDAPALGYFRGRYRALG